MERADQEQYVRELLRLHTGLVFPAARHADVQREIELVVEKSGSGDITAYARALQTDPGRLADLVERLTVKESYFFRHAQQLEFLSQIVFPEMARANPARSPRIWSAGCAGGEEAYTLGLLAAEHFRAARILGTDISSHALQQARLAVYSPWSLRSVSPAQIERYFVCKDNRCRFRKNLAGDVDFRLLNLAADRYPSLSLGLCDLDIIVCRNVLIYFDADVAQDVVARLVQCLRPGGWLILGPSDPPVTRNPELEAIVTSEGVYYRRRESSSLIVGAARCGRVEDGLEPKAVLESPKPAAAGEAPVDPLSAVEVAFARCSWAEVDRLASNLPDNLAACALRIRALSNANLCEEAAAVASTAMTDHPLCPELQFLAAVVNLAMGRDRDSERLLRRAIYLDRSMAIAHFLLGLVLERRGETAASRISYRNAVRSAETQPPDTVLPLCNGEPAHQIAAAARQRLDDLRARKSA